MSLFAPGIITALAFFILSLASGIWLTRLGKPLNILILTLHKLISVAAAIFTGLAIYYPSRTVVINTLKFSAITGAGLLFLILIISGAVLSDGKPGKNAVLDVHKFTPLLALLCTAVALLLLSGGQS